MNHEWNGLKRQSAIHLIYVAYFQVFDAFFSAEPRVHGIGAMHVALDLGDLGLCQGLLQESLEGVGRGLHAQLLAPTSFDVSHLGGGEAEDRRKDVQCKAMTSKEMHLSYDIYDIF